MKKQLFYFISGIILVLFSAPLGRETLFTIYRHKNLAREALTLLKCSANAYVLTGIMLQNLKSQTQLWCRNIYQFLFMGRKV